MATSKIYIEMQGKDKKMESRSAGGLLLLFSVVVFFLVFFSFCERLIFILQSGLLCVLTPVFVVLKRAEISVKSCSSVK